MGWLDTLFPCFAWYRPANNAKEGADVSIPVAATFILNPLFQNSG